tara:strand:+ start:124 stop:528 length:405 start_codon:yes stop_codon:yes gene_type:complete
MNAICTSNMMRGRDHAERTPLAKSKFTSTLVTLPFGTDPDSDTFKEAAEQLGVTTEDLSKVIQFSTTMNDEAHRLKLDPPHVVSACLNMVGDLLNNYVSDEFKADMVTSIFRQLWAHAGLASDHSEGEKKNAGN